MFISEEVKLLCRDIEENYNNWIQTEYIFKNEISGMGIWTGNGVLFINFYPGISSFNIFEKYKILKAIKIANCLNCIKSGEE